jgi:glycosyltransferase involved in cell wall biosynthesis/GT2 family glycosyltransferase
MRVSVIINTYNRASNLVGAIESLKFQSYEDFEVIVVNGPSSDETKSVVADSGARYYEISEVNLSISRNVGLREAKGEVVAFMDDDAQPDNDWLANIVREFSLRPDVGAVGGPILDNSGIRFQCYYNVGNRFGKAREVFYNPSDAFSFPQTAEYPTLTGCNCAFRLDLLAKIGGFDEQYAYFLEETDLCLRIVDAGYEVRFAPDVVVHHKFAPSHLRVEGNVIKNYYPSLRSVSYFARKHTVKYYSDGAAEMHLENIQREHYEGLRWNYQHGKYTKQEFEDVSEHSKRAFVDGSSDLKALYWDGEGSTDEFLPFRTAAANVTSRKMRVVYVSREFFPGPVGGIARLTESLASGMAGLGHKVHVITRAHDGVSRVDFVDGYWVNRVADVRDIAQFESEYDLPRVILERAVAVQAEVKRIESMFPIDIISAPIWDVEGALLLDEYNDRLVTTLHTTYKLSLKDHPKWLNDKNFFEKHVSRIIDYEKNMITGSKNVLANSQSIVQCVETEYGLRMHGYGKVPHGVDSPPAHYVPSELYDASCVNLLFLGRLEPRKGIDLLMKSAATLLAKRDNAILWLCGDDSIFVEGEKFTYKEHYDRIYGHEAWYSRVKYLGFVSTDELPELLGGCDIFVAPSRFESFGLIHAEALSYGKPVVALNASATPEVVTSEVGLLADVDDPVSLMKCLDVLIEDVDMREQMGNSARQRYLERFTIERMIEESEKYYCSIINNY